jgi:hypothetical protein
MLQEILAELIDTTRSWLNLFMNKFMKLPSFTTMAGPYQQPRLESQDNPWLTGTRWTNSSGFSCEVFLQF